jgi:ATP-binding cassette subfamily C (CFTR/MRP) protein 4
MKTDAFIQKVIREKFKETTVITIAHRLNTVTDYDNIIVMHYGRIVEAGAPFELLEKKGVFFEMVEHTGKNAELIKQHIRDSKRNKTFDYASMKPS